MESAPETHPGPSNILVHRPGSDHTSLADGEGGFDRCWFMGRWNVQWSTLPMWKGKRDITINYEPVAAESKIDTIFSSVVTYHKESAAKGSKPSTVSGTETLSTGANGATFDWKGSGMLFFVHSHWEVLGYGKDEASQLEWAATYFSKTLFTPAGIDIYIRRSKAASGDPVAGPSPEALKELRNRIIEAVQANEHEGVAKLAKGGFTIPGEDL